MKDKRFEQMSTRCLFLLISDCLAWFWKNCTSRTYGDSRMRRIGKYAAWGWSVSSKVSQPCQIRDTPVYGDIPLLLTMANFHMQMFQTFHFIYFVNTIFVSSYNIMYTENPEETQVIVSSMNMGYDLRSAAHVYFVVPSHRTDLGHEIICCGLSQ